MLRFAAIRFAGLVLVTAMGCAAEDWDVEPEGIVAPQSGETLLTSEGAAEAVCTYSSTTDEYTCAESSEPADELAADDVVVDCGCGCSGCSANYECVYDCNPEKCCNACKQGLPPCGT
jgi:hypothetical protein